MEGLNKYTLTFNKVHKITLDRSVEKIVMDNIEYNSSAAKYIKQLKKDYTIHSPNIVLIENNPVKIKDRILRGTYPQESLTSDFLKTFIFIPDWLTELF